MDGLGSSLSDTVGVAVALAQASSRGPPAVDGEAQVPGLSLRGALRVLHTVKSAGGGTVATVTVEVL
jgi:hypothetical protein